MSKLIRGAILATLLCALPRCGGTDSPADPSASAGQSAGGTTAGDAGSKSGGSGGSADVANAGSTSAGAAGTAEVGGSAGTSTTGGAAGASTAGAAGAGGAVGVVGCGGMTCAPNEYCRAPCSGTGFGFGGTTGLPMTPPMPSCYPLPAACNGIPTCDCVCGVSLGFAPWCSTGSKPIPPGPAVQCGCA